MGPMNVLAELLEANARFYAAFNAHDLTALAALWDDGGPVACVHPGWRALTNRREILESWRAIFEGGGPTKIECRAPEAFVLGSHGEGAAAGPGQPASGHAGAQGMVVCYEAIGDALLVATNLFRRTDAGWRLVHHHAGPCNEPPAEATTTPARGSLQ
jgi:ketosteroid isomerase-like protein